MKNLSIRKANINDLSYIQELNNNLFDLGSENYDPTLVKDWAISNDGKMYFEDFNLTLTMNID